MAVELPEPLQWVLLLLAGTRWPEGQEDLMRDMGRRWRAAAETLDEAGRAADSAVRRALDGQQGAAAEGLEKDWNKLVLPADGSKPGFFPGMVKSCNAMADSLEAMANSTETAKISIVAQLGILAFEIATAEAAAPVTAGASLATIPASIAVSKTTVQMILKKLAKEIMEYALKEAFQEVAINLLAQSIQLAAGNRKELDGKELGMSAAGGAIGGAAGGLIGKGLGAAGGKLIGKKMDTLPAQMVEGAITDVGADVVTQLALTGEVDGSGLGGSALSGAGSPAIMRGASALKGKFNSSDIPDASDFAGGSDIPGSGSSNSSGSGDSSGSGSSNSSGSSGSDSSTGSGGSSSSGSSGSSGSGGSNSSGSSGSSGSGSSNSSGSNGSGSSSRSDGWEDSNSSGSSGSGSSSRSDGWDGSNSSDTPSSSGSDGSGSSSKPDSHGDTTSGDQSNLSDVGNDGHNIRQNYSEGTTPDTHSDSGNHSNLSDVGSDGHNIRQNYSEDTPRNFSANRDASTPTPDTAPYQGPATTRGEPSPQLAPYEPPTHRTPDNTPDNTPNSTPDPTPTPRTAPTTDGPPAGVPHQRQTPDTDQHDQSTGTRVAGLGPVGMRTAPSTPGYAPSPTGEFTPPQVTPEAPVQPAAPPAPAAAPAAAPTGTPTPPSAPRTGVNSTPPAAAPLAGFGAPTAGGAPSGPPVAPAAQPVAPPVRPAGQPAAPPAAPPVQPAAPPVAGAKKQRNSAFERTKATMNDRGYELARPAQHNALQRHLVEDRKARLAGEVSRLKKTPKRTPEQEARLRDLEKLQRDTATLLGEQDVEVDPATLKKLVDRQNQLWEEHSSYRQLREPIAMREREIAELDKQFEPLRNQEQQLQQLQNEGAELQRELNDLTGRLQANQNQMAALQAHPQPGAAEVTAFQTLQAEHAALMAQGQDRQTQFQDKQQQHQQLDAVHQQAKAAFAPQINRKQQLEAELAQRPSPLLQVDGVIAYKQRKAAELEAEHDRRNSEVLRREQQLAALPGEAAALRTRAQEHEALHQQTGDARHLVEIQRLTKEAGDKEKAYTDLVAKHHRVAADIATITAERRRLEADVAALKKTSVDTLISQTEQRIEQLRNNPQRTPEESAEGVRRVAELAELQRRKQSGSDELINRQERRLAQIKAEMDRTDQDAAAQEQKRQQLAADIGALNADPVGAMKQQLGQVQTELETVYQQLDQADQLTEPRQKQLESILRRQQDAFNAKPGLYPHRAPTLTPALLGAVNPHVVQAANVETVDPNAAPRQSLRPGVDLNACLENTEALRATYYGSPRVSGQTLTGTPEPKPAWTLARLHERPRLFGQGPKAVDILHDQLREAGKGSFAVVLVHGGTGTVGHAMALVHDTDGELKWADTSTRTVRPARQGEMPPPAQGNWNVWAAAAGPQDQPLSQIIRQSTGTPVSAIDVDGKPLVPAQPGQPAQVPLAEIDSNFLVHFGAAEQNGGPDQGDGSFGAPSAPASARSAPLPTAEGGADSTTGSDAGTTTSRSLGPVSPGSGDGPTGSRSAPSAPLGAGDGTNNPVSPSGRDSDPAGKRPSESEDLRPAKERRTPAYERTDGQMDARGYNLARPSQLGTLQQHLVVEQQNRIKQEIAALDGLARGADARNDRLDELKDDERAHAARWPADAPQTPPPAVLMEQADRRAEIDRLRALARTEDARAIRLDSLRRLDADATSLLTDQGQRVPAGDLARLSERQNQLWTEHGDLRQAVEPVLGRERLAGQLQSKQQELTEKSKREQQEINRLAAESDRLNAEAAKLNPQVPAEQVRRAELEAQWNAVQQQGTALHNQNQQTEAEIAQAQADQQKAEQEATAFRTEIQRAGEISLQHDQLTDRAQREQQEIGRLAAERDRLNEEAAKLDSQVPAEQVRRAELEAQWNAVQQQGTALHNQNQQTEAELAAKKTELLAQEARVAEQSVALREGGLDGAREQELSEKSQREQQEINRLAAERDRLDAETAKLDPQVPAEQVRRAELEAQRNAVQQQGTALHNQNQQTEAELAPLQAKRRRMEQEAAVFSASQQSASRTIMSKESQLAEHKAEYDQASADAPGQEQQLKLLQGEISRLTAEAPSSQAKADQLRAKEQEFQELQGRNQQAREDIARYDQLTAEVAGLRQDRIAAIQAEVDQRRNDIQAVDTELSVHDAAAKPLNDEMQKLADRQRKALGDPSLSDPAAVRKDTYPELSTELLQRINPHFVQVANGATTDLSSAPRDSLRPGTDLNACLENTEALRDTHYGRPRVSGQTQTGQPEPKPARTMNRRHDIPRRFGQGPEAVNILHGQLTQAGPGSFALVLVHNGAQTGHVMALVNGPDGQLRWADTSTRTVTPAAPGAMPPPADHSYTVWASVTGPKEQPLSEMPSADDPNRPISRIDLQGNPIAAPPAPGQPGPTPMPETDTEFRNAFGKQFGLAKIGPDGYHPATDYRPQGSPGGLVDPSDQDNERVNSAVPHDVDGKPQVHPDPDNGNWTASINGDGPRTPGRNNNCADVALAMVDTYSGHPTAAASRTPDLDAAGRPSDLGEANGRARIENSLGAKFGDYGDGRAAFDRLEGQLRQSGHGSQAVIITSDKDGRSHAWNAVNHNGKITYIDGQTGQRSPQPLHNGDSGVFAVPLGSDRKPAGQTPMTADHRTSPDRPGMAPAPGMPPGYEPTAPKIKPPAIHRITMFNSYVKAGAFPEPGSVEETSSSSAPVPAPAKVAVIGVVPAVLNDKLDLFALADEYRKTGLSSADRQSNDKLALVIGVNAWDGRTNHKALEAKFSTEAKDFAEKWKNQSMPVTVVGFSWSNTEVDVDKGPEQNTILYGAVRQQIVSMQAVQEYEEALQGLHPEGVRIYLHTSDSDTTSFTTVQGRPLFSEVDASFEAALEAAAVREASQQSDMRKLAKRQADLLAAAGKETDPDKAAGLKEAADAVGAERATAIKAAAAKLRRDEAPLDLVSGGYSAPANAPEDQRFALEVDNEVRAAMARVDPRLVYFPEPNTFVRVEGYHGGLGPSEGFGVGSKEGQHLVDSIHAQRPGAQQVFLPDLAIETDLGRIGKKVEAEGPLGLAQSHAAESTWIGRLEHVYKIDANEKLMLSDKVYKGVSKQGPVGLPMSEAEILKERDRVANEVLGDLTKGKKKPTPRDIALARVAGETRAALVRKLGLLPADASA